MDELNTLQSLGLTLPTPAYLFGIILFGVIGFAAYRHGRKNGLKKAKWLGIALMLYPYVVSDTGLLYVVGVALTASLFI
ncbi:MAG: hypothetical protein PHX10_12800 [Gallionellaceae bacterium]|nr:hypothetical protein [Gallionellaceae bacterium]